MSTPIESLHASLQARFPEATIHLDRPGDPDGLWLLDVEHDGYGVEVEWHPSYGFGISARDAAYGEGPDEAFEDVQSAYTRVRRLLLSHAPTAPPREVALSELRRLQSVSQVELAERLAVSQASVSKTERRSDLLLGTLRQFVTALGGTLEIRARFEDETVRILIEEPR